MVGKLREKDIEQEWKRASMLQQQPRSCAHWRWWRWYFYMLRFTLIAVAFGTSFLWGLAALHVPPFSTIWNKQLSPSVAATLSFWSSGAQPMTFHARNRWEAQASEPLRFQFWIRLLRGHEMQFQIWPCFSRLVHKVYQVFFVPKQVRYL